MKFKIGDQVLVTAGKDKGKKSTIVQVLPKTNQVVVKDVNLYVKHVKPYGERSGEKIKKARPLPLSKIAILNDKGNPDRIAYKVLKDGKKERIFKKTAKPVPESDSKIKKSSKK